MTRPPRPSAVGRTAVDHGAIAHVLEQLRDGGQQELAGLAGLIDEYLRAMSQVDPDRMNSAEALAFWLNVYNAGALRLAGRAAASGAPTVLRIPGGFRSEFVQVGAESLSLDAIEHGKVRRFGDPRIHGALVCGAVSCPTLRSEPYRGRDLHRQLDDQMVSFLASGAATFQPGEPSVTLSRVFLWYGADFVHPQRMPTVLPSRPRRILAALTPWLPREIAEHVREGRFRVRFAPYDWGLRCAVR